MVTLTLQHSSQSSPSLGVTWGVFTPARVLSSPRDARALV